MAKHYGIDGRHLTICGVCTCSDDRLRFTQVPAEVTCEACRLALAKVLPTSIGKKHDRKEGP